MPGHRARRRDGRARRQHPGDRDRRRLGARRCSPASSPPCRCCCSPSPPSACPFTLLGALQYLVPTINLAARLARLRRADAADRLVGFALVWAALVAVTVDQVPGPGPAGRRRPPHAHGRRLACRPRSDRAPGVPSCAVSPSPPSPGSPSSASPPAAADPTPATSRARPRTSSRATTLDGDRGRRHHVHRRRVRRAGVDGRRHGLHLHRRPAPTAQTYTFTVEIAGENALRVVSIDPAPPPGRRRRRDHARRPPPAERHARRSAASRRRTAAARRRPRRAGGHRR